MIFGLTRMLSGSFHILLNSLPEGCLVAGGLMSHISLYKNISFIDVTCILAKKILGDRFSHDTKKLSLVSTSTVFPLSLLGNSSPPDLQH